MGAVSEGFRTYERDAKVPVFKNGGLNPRAYGQISSGSVVGMLGVIFGEGGMEALLGDAANVLVTIGLLGGVAVSTFSKTLAMLFGLLVFGVQVCLPRARGMETTRC